MALTVPTHQYPERGKWIYYTGGLGANDNDILFDLEGEGVIEVIAYSTTNAFDVFGSLDGTNFSATPLALEDMTSTTPATRVITSTADKPVRLVGVGFRKLRFLQNGAGAPTNFSVAVRIA